MRFCHQIKPDEVFGTHRSSFDVFASSLTWEGHAENWHGLARARVGFQLLLQSFD
jgi:hypothetical protein